MELKGQLVGLVREGVYVLLILNGIESHVCRHGVLVDYVMLILNGIESLGKTAEKDF